MTQEDTVCARAVKVVYSSCLTEIVRDTEWFTQVFSRTFLDSVLRELAIKRVEGGDDFDTALVFVEFNGVLDQMEEDLFVNLPVGAYPFWDLVCLNNLYM